ncbi:MAG: AMP-binding protein [Deltaproteobacteria bacterium]|nr:AMP-binding protein [Deltaproteobacteria bacterium]
MSVIDLFDRGHGISPDGVYLVADGYSCTYREARRLSLRIANRLLEKGFAPETRGAVLAPNDPVAWTTTLGIWRAGLAWVPINPRGTPDSFHDVLDRFDARVLFFHGVFTEVVGALRGKLERVGELVCLDRETPFAPSLETWLAGASEAEVELAIAPEQLCMIQATGGTTGRPKGVMLTHRNLLAFTANLIIGTPYPDGVPVNLAAAPMTHTAGVLSLGAAARGGRLVILQRPDPALLPKQIEEHRVSELFLPPTVIYRLLEVPGIESHDYGSLRYFLYGAAPMSTEKLRRAIDVFGPVMTQFYGQSEAPGTISYLSPAEHLVDGKPAGDERLSSCGRPTPLVQVAILDDDGRRVAPGETGEICVRGDLVMRGYYEDPEQTAQAIVGGWLHTGDVGRFDAEGRLHITDRKKDMIISGGFNVYPSEIEQVLWSHPAVQDCAVIGVPDADWGEAVKAVVECRPGATVEVATLLDLCRERLGGVRTPKSVDFVAELPRSPAGKVLKRELRERYWAGATRRI